MMSDSLHIFLVVLKRNALAWLLVGALGAVLAPRAHGQVHIDFTFDGTDTTVDWAISAGGLAPWASLEVFDASGTSGESSLFLDGQGSFDFLRPVEPFTTYLNGGDPLSVSGDIPWSNGSYTADTMGDVFGYNVGLGVAYVPVGYSFVTGAALSGSIVITETSLADMGLPAMGGSGSFAVSGVTVSWNASTPSAVPEPSTYAVMAGVVVLGIAVLRRRSRPGVPAAS